jgi:hypothetical protein
MVAFILMLSECRLKVYMPQLFVSTGPLTCPMVVAGCSLQHLLAANINPEAL